MITTLNKIRNHSPCREGWEKLLRHLGKTQADDDPLPIATVLDSNGLDDALWCLRAVEGQDQEIRLYAVWCARRVQHLMGAETERSDAAHAAAWAARAGSARPAARAAADAASLAAADAAWEAAGAGAAAEAAAAAASISGRDAEEAAQADELRRMCREIEAGRDPYPEEEGR